MENLIWWGFGWHTPLTDIGWTWVFGGWAVAIPFYFIIKNRRGWK